VLFAYLKRKFKDERVLARYAIYASVRRARDQEEEPRTLESRPLSRSPWPSSPPT
jgi:hypothetical protein